MARIWLLGAACCLALAVHGQPRGDLGRGGGQVYDPVAAEAMRAAAAKLLESVRGDPEFNEALRQFSMENDLKLPLAAAARRDWSYWPRDRAGLKIALMHAKHRALLHDLLWSALSAGGYHKVLNIMELENVLEASSTTGFPRGVEQYTITLFGEPSATQPWGWRFEGDRKSVV